jgi:hypothetical protein
MTSRASPTCRRSSRPAIACSRTDDLRIGQRGLSRRGGWNPASPAGSEAFDEEHAWHVEGGVKGMFAGRPSGGLQPRSSRSTGTHLQLNVPNPFVPGQFYIANVGEATSRGVELESAGPPAFDHAALRRCRLHQRPLRRRHDLERRGTSRTIASRTCRTTRPRLGAHVEGPITSTITLFGRAESGCSTANME